MSYVEELNMKKPDYIIDRRNEPRYRDRETMTDWRGN